MKVGERVVCVDNEHFFTTGETNPIVGEIYKVREIYTVDNLVGVRLVEVINKPRHYSDGFLECGFLITNFRPIENNIGEKVCEYITKECEKIKTPETV